MPWLNVVTLILIFGHDLNLKTSSVVLKSYMVKFFTLNQHRDMYINQNRDSVINLVIRKPYRSLRAVYSSIWGSWTILFDQTKLSKSS